MDTAFAEWTPAPAGAAPWTVIAILVTAAIIASSARLVPARHWVVVLRSGCVVRVAASGLVVHVPGVEQQVLLTRNAVEVPLVVRGRSADGTEVRLAADATFRIVDPALAAKFSPTPLQLATDEAERTLGALIRRCDLGSLAVLPSYGDVLEQIPVPGVRTIALRIERIDVELTIGLLRAASGQTK